MTVQHAGPELHFKLPSEYFLWPAGSLDPDIYTAIFTTLIYNYRILSPTPSPSCGSWATSRWGSGKAMKATEALSNLLDTPLGAEGEELTLLPPMSRERGKV